MSESQGYVPEGAEAFVAPITESAPAFEAGQVPEHSQTETPSEVGGYADPTEALPTAAPAPPALETGLPQDARPAETGEEWLRRYLGPSTQLGRGAHKTVYTHPTNERWAVATYRDESALPPPFAERYYTRKLMHLVEPRCTPDIHLSTSSPELIVLDRITPKAENLFVRAVRRITEPVERRLLTRRLRQGLGLWIDTNAVNFMRDATGKLVYVDEPTNELDLGPANRQNLEAHLRRRLKGDELRRAGIYLDRIDVARKARSKETQSEHRTRDVQG